MVEKLAPLVRGISWTKNLMILAQGKDSAERQFYLERGQSSCTGPNVRIHQIENSLREDPAQSNCEVGPPSLTKALISDLEGTLAHTSESPRNGAD